MGEIIYKCTTITPMFLAGYDGMQAELRPPSFKGAIRFWWRALQAESDYKKLLQKEEKIFGGTSNNGFKSKVIVLISNPEVNSNNSKKLPQHNISVSSKGRNFSINILDYLAYGISNYKKGEGCVIDRSYINAGSKFELKLIYDDKLNKNDVSEIDKAVIYMSVFGGVGAKSRNGFGRIFIEENDKYANVINELINNPFRNGLCEYTSFSNDMRLFQLEKRSNKWDDVLADLAKIYKSSREALENKHRFDVRQYIASPIEVKQEGGLKSILERHAKTYFFSIHKKTISDPYSGYILFLPYKYGSKHDKISFQLDNHLKAYTSANNLMLNVLGQRMKQLI